MVQQKVKFEVKCEITNSKTQKFKDKKSRFEEVKNYRNQNFKELKNSRNQEVMRAKIFVVYPINEIIKPIFN